MFRHLTPGSRWTPPSPKTAFLSSGRPGPSKATDRIIAVSPEEQTASGLASAVPGDPHLQRGRAGAVSADGCGPPRVVPAGGLQGRRFHRPLSRAEEPYVLIKAFATTANMLPQCRLVVVGSGPLERSLRVMADLLGIANKVLWLGEDRDGKCLLPAFDLLALPSRYEGLPYVTLEALSAGLPVVATATAGVDAPDPTPVKRPHRPTGPSRPLRHGAGGGLCSTRSSSSSSAAGRGRSPRSSPFGGWSTAPMMHTSIALG